MTAPELDPAHQAQGSSHPCLATHLGTGESSSSASLQSKFTQSDLFMCFLIISFVIAACKQKKLMTKEGSRKFWKAWRGAGEAEDLDVKPGSAAESFVRVFGQHISLGHFLTS